MNLIVYYIFYIAEVSFFFSILQFTFYVKASSNKHDYFLKNERFSSLPLV